MNITLKRTLIRLTIIFLLILFLIVGFTSMSGTDVPETTATTTCTEEPTQETQTATEPETMPTEETEPAQETIPTEAPTETPEPTETETPTETTPTITAPPIATEPPTEQPTTLPETTGPWQSLGTYKLTAYCSCYKCCGQYALNRPIDENGNPIVYTSIGAIAKAGTTIAVDPRVIPYGSEVKINDHIYIAQDTGGAIKGNRIDVYFDDHQDALQFGVQWAEVFLQTEAA